MKAQQLSLDTITTLPQTIIEIILCLLPIKEAVRTSILSKEWRYKWTKIPKLVLYQYCPDGRQWMEADKLLCVIHQVMLQHQDPIQEFTLCIDDVHLFSEIGHHSRKMDQIILDLSRNHIVKKLTLIFSENSDGLYNLPLSLFSMHHLTELHLGWCDLYHQPDFNGFVSLTTLSLIFVRISSKTLLHLLSNCPSLKNFYMAMTEECIIGNEKSTMIELFECLPMIEHLTVSACVLFKLFILDLFPQELPTLLVHLKYFCLDGMSFHDGYGLTFLALLIKSSPNLEKLELLAGSDRYEGHHFDVWLEHMSEVWLANLIELKMGYFRNLEFVKFVKFILVRSPKLKKVSIISRVKKDQETEMLKTLLRAPRASAVEIDVV